MNSAAQIYQISACNNPRVFTLSEAEELFPLMWKITEDAYRELEPVRRTLEAMVPSNPQVRKVEKEYETIVRRWMGKMERLGLVGKGLWLGGFATGGAHL